MRKSAVFVLNFDIFVLKSERKVTDFVVVFSPFLSLVLSVSCTFYIYNLAPTCQNVRFRCSGGGRGPGPKVSCRPLERPSGLPSESRDRAARQKTASPFQTPGPWIYSAPGPHYFLQVRWAPAARLDSVSEPDVRKGD